MTAYEILELRSSVGTRMFTATRLWLTVTMAVFAVAYYAGQNLDVFSIVVLLAFHGLIVVVGINLFSLASGHLQALAKDAEYVNRHSDHPVHALNQNLVGEPMLVARLARIIMALSFFAFAAYLYQMTA